MRRANWLFGMCSTCCIYYLYQLYYIESQFYIKLKHFHIMFKTLFGFLLRSARKNVIICIEFENRKLASYCSTIKQLRIKTKSENYVQSNIYNAVKISMYTFLLCVMDFQFFPCRGRNYQQSLHGKPSKPCQLF